MFPKRFVVLMKGKWMLAASAALLSMAAYLGTLNATFVYDDIIYIKNNPQLREPGDLFETPFPAYMGPMRGLYRPVTTASLALDYRLYGLEPWGFHLTNLVLHGCGTLVFFLVLSRLVPGRWSPFFGALLFGLHPARSEAVAWAVGRSELLAALGCLAALLLYIRFTETRKSPLPILGSLAAFAFAGLSKENALAFPGILAAYELFLMKGDRWRLRILRICPFIVVTLLILAVRYGVLESLSPQEGQRVLADVHYPKRFLIALWALGRYLGLACWPFPLKPHYRPLEFFEAGFLDYVPAILFLLASCAAILLSRRWAFTAALFLVPLLPVLNLVPIGEAFAERFIYMPLAGAGLAFGIILSRFEGKKTAPWAFAASSALILLCGILTIRQAEVWTDHSTLWSHAVSVDPDNPQPRLGIGVVYLNKGIIEEKPGALSELHKALELNPNFKRDQVHHNLGRAYERLGDLGRALEHYDKAAQYRSRPAMEAYLDLYLREVAAGNYQPESNAKSVKEKLRTYYNQLMQLTRDDHKKAELREKYGSLGP